MRTLLLISGLLAACGLATAQTLAVPRAERGVRRPRTSENGSPQLYLSFPVAGTPGASGYMGDGGPASAAQLANPIAVVIDSQGDYYISDYENHVIREVFKSNGSIATIAGTGTPGYSGDGGPATSAQFFAATSLALDAAGNLYIADAPSGRVRVINAATGIISTFAGNGSYGDAGDGGLAVNATLFYPVGVAVDSNGNVFIADYGNSTVRMVSAATGIITTVAGIDVTGYGNFPGEGGPAVQAYLGLPYAVAVDESGNLFIDDIGTSSIRKVGRDGNIHTILSNVSTASLTTDPAGNLYFADYRNGVINKVLPDNTVITLAGISGASGYAGDGGPAILAVFNAPYSVALDSSGNIYVADYNNDVIRELTAVAPPGVIVANGASNVGYSAPGAPLSVAPGEVITIFGTNIGYPPGAAAQPDANGIFETQFASTVVTFNGIPAPILISGPSYVSVVAPYELYGSGATQVNILVMYQGQTTAAATVPYADAPSVAIFTSISTGIPGGLPILNSDGTANSTSNAAAESSTITVFVTGESQTSPAGVDGLVNGSSNTPVPLLPVIVYINGTEAVVTAEEAPGQVAGVLQLSVTLPSSQTTSSAVPVQVQVGSSLSQIVDIAVQ